MSFSLTILGSSSALPTSRRNPSAHVLNVHEHFFLIDCGEGTQLQINKYNIRLGKINHVFISHLHGDHMFGLYGLFSTFNLLNREHDLHIYAHPEINHTIKYYKDWFGNKLSYNIIIHPFKSNRRILIFENKHMTVESFPLKHRIPTVGFIFREKEKPRNIKKEVVEKYNIPVKEIVKIKQGEDFTTSEGQTIKNEQLTLPPYRLRSYAYCSDTLYTKRYIEYIKGVNLLFHETTFLNRDKDLAKQTYHSTAFQAATIAKEAGVGKLLIGHFSARYKDVSVLVEEARKIFKNTYAVEDGDNFRIEPERIKIR
jgi:ribonuclease Z